MLHSNSLGTGLTVAAVLMLALVQVLRWQRAPRWILGVSAGCSGVLVLLLAADITARFVALGH